MDTTPVNIREVIGAHVDLVGPWHHQFAREFAVNLPADLVREWLEAIVRYDDVQHRIREATP